MSRTYLVGIVGAVFRGLLAASCGIAIAATSYLVIDPIEPILLMCNRESYWYNSILYLGPKFIQATGIGSGIILVQLVGLKWSLQKAYTGKEPAVPRRSRLFGAFIYIVSVCLAYIGVAIALQIALVTQNGNAAQNWQILVEVSIIVAAVILHLLVFRNQIQNVAQYLVYYGLAATVPAAIF